MARKSKRTMKALSGLTRKVSAIHPSSGSLIAGKHAGTMKNPHRDDSSNPTQMQAGSPGPGSSASSVTSSIDGADGNEDDGAEEDPDEDDNGDADEMAPSDAAIASNGHQTGPIIGRSLKHNPSSGEKQKHSLDNIGNKKERARRRKASKSIGQVEDENAGFDDDDDYHGVDLISDSEEEEPTVEQLEEKVIIESEEEYDSNCRTPPVLPSISSDGWPGFELEGNLFLSDVPYFDEQIGRTDPSILAEEIEIFNTTNFSQGFCDIEVPPRLTPERRVRFAEDVEEPDNASTVVSDTKGGSLGLAKREEGVTSENHDSEDEDTDSTSGRSSGYESGYCYAVLSVLQR